MNDNTRGFTLIELAVAMFILVLLLGSILVPLTTQVEQRQISDTQKTLEEIKEAITGFAIANKYLPCPDITAGVNSNDGVEDVTGTNCTSAEGNLPWATLGVASTDAWGNRFRYRIDTDFTNRDPSSMFGLSSSADLQVCTTATCSATAPEMALTQASPNGTPVVILSHGRNGLGAIGANTNAANPAPTSANELENTDGDNRFVSRVVSTAAGSEFDDIVIWLPRYVLLNRMISAGKLP
jgi:prepilin-type N-terminal cleavage/methylation domain-containing protein